MTSLTFRAKATRGARGSTTKQLQIPTPPLESERAGHASITKGEPIVSLRKTLAIIAADKLKLALALSALSVVVAAGVTFGSWSVSGTGNGYAKAVTPSNLTLGDASASTVAQLYPGGTGDVKVSITNPNTFGVTITGITGNGTIVTAPTNATCDASTGVTYTDQTGLSLALAGGATTTFTLTVTNAAGETATASATIVVN